MSDQPEALRLADAIDPLTRKDLDNLTCAAAAAELRRLHAENERCRAVCAATSEGWRRDAEGWQAQRDALLKVVRKYIAWSDVENDHKGTDFWERVEMCREVDELARAAIVDAAVRGKK